MKSVLFILKSTLVDKSEFCFNYVIELVKSSVTKNYRAQFFTFMMKNQYIKTYSWFKKTHIHIRSKQFYIRLIYSCQRHNRQLIQACLQQIAPWMQMVFPPYARLYCVYMYITLHILPYIVYITFSWSFLLIDISSSGSMNGTVL
jgi:hypothetical protein